MKTVLATLILLLISVLSYSQKVTSIPQFPTIEGEITIRFDATDSPLENTTGDIYAHTGVMLETSADKNDWKYVKTNWGENTPETKLTKTAPNIYELKITPDIISYYKVADNEVVMQMAFVFRSSDANKQTSNIYVDVFLPGLTVKIDNPSNSIISDINQDIAVSISGKESEKIDLLIDNELITSTTLLSLNYTISISVPGNHWLKAKAWAGADNVTDSVSIYVKKDQVIKDLPSGLRDGINYTSDNSVTLVLYAPGKQDIFVVGDFNKWILSDNYLMNKTKDGKRFWLEINNLEKGKEYIFQYLIDGNIRIADPYSEKISDPWNDKNISSDTYPNLIAYPEGKTTEIATVIKTGQSLYNWEIDSYAIKNPENMIIYEMLIRDFTIQKTYISAIEKLDYLKEMGINAIELMPVNEFEGNSSWGYNPSFYFAPDKAYGTKDDLKKFVDECHKRDMAVFIDLVLNHSYGQSPLVRMYFENGKPTASNPWYNIEHNFTNTGAHWGYDFNHESADTQMLIDSINSYWMSIYKIDGFRFDFTKGFSNNLKTSSDEWASIYDADRVRILKRMTAEIHKRKSDAIVIFEHLAEDKEEKELANFGIKLWGNMNNNYAEASMAYNESNKSDLSRVYYKNRGFDEPNLVSYMESHDEQRIMYKNTQWGNKSDNYNIKHINIGLNRLALNATFFFTIPGPKMIWQFGELGYDINIDENGRTGDKPVLWNYFEMPERKRIYQVYRELIKLRNSNDVFKNGNVTLDVSGKYKQIKITGSDMDVVIAGNFDIYDADFITTFPKPGKWYEYFSGAEIDVTNTSSELHLKPGEYRIFTSKNAGKANIDELSGINYVSDYQIVTSNPINDILKISLPEKFCDIECYNILGKLIFKSFNNGQNTIIDCKQWKPGSYLLVANKKGRRIVSSLIIKQ